MSSPKKIPRGSFQMDVSKNSGTPKSSILIGFSIIFTIHFGIPLLETPRWWDPMSIPSTSVLGDFFQTFLRLGKQEQCNVVRWWPNAQTSRKGESLWWLWWLCQYAISKLKIVKQTDLMKGNIMWQDEKDACNRHKKPRNKYTSLIYEPLNHSVLWPSLLHHHPNDWGLGQTRYWQNDIAAALGAWKPGELRTRCRAGKTGLVNGW